MKLLLCVVPILVAMFGLAACAGADVLVLDDPLQGSTTGTFNGGSGQFVTGGWKITNRADAIYWHLPYTIYNGAAEFTVTGLNPNECRPGLSDKSDLFHMYDWTYANADTDYNGYRNNPFKHFVRKTGCDGSYNNTVNALELVLVIAPNYQEPDTPILSWSPSATYVFREEWGPDGSGNCVFKTYRDGVLLKTMIEPGSWSPFGHSVRIGQARLNEWEGAPLDAVFSSIKVWDRETSPPATPVITYPVQGKTINTRTPRVRWAWTPTFNRYQVRITTGNSPTTGIAWDSGAVMSVRNYATTGTLTNLTNYYVWLKLGNAVGWTDWSASGQTFRVDTSYTPPNPGMTQVVGNSLQNNSGAFLGLGFTYMEGHGFCRTDRERFESDVAFMASRGFNYMRILSEVPGACDQDYWYGRSINASNYTCPHGVTANAWPDYDQQFRDMLDIAYDKYGMRAEVTIFGGAGDSFPAYADRQTHCQRILNLIAGREHKIAFLEVANEGWQTGFDYPQGVTDMRNLCKYLTDRTSVPVAISATPWGNYPDPNQTLVELYCGSTADLSTEHFERDIRSSEGGWLPVRDCWRVENQECLVPCSSDEPIGPGSSVNTELDPIKLVSAACFAWIAKLPAYVYHTSAGVRGDYRFEDHAGVNDYRYLAGIIPGDVASWRRNDGLTSSAPFKVFCNGQPDKYWTDVPGATTGCHRNIGGVKARRFVCYPQGILGGGLNLQAREDISFTVYNPLTGQVADTRSLLAGESFTLPQGPGAYIIKGDLLTPDTVQPGQVTSFAVNPGDAQNTLTWRNPTDDDFIGTKVVFRTDRYPMSATDGAVACDKEGGAGAAGQHVHTGLTNGLTYYYSAFAYDGMPNYSPAALAQGAPIAGQCFFESFTYPDGGLNGNRAWAGSATSEVQVLSNAARISAGADTRDAIHYVSCSGGGVIDTYVHVKLGSGSNTTWGVWFDDPAGNNLARWYGSGSTARPRIAGTGSVLDPVNLTGGWDLLRLRIDTAANTSEFFFNGVSLGTLNHSITGAGNSIGRVMLERIGNTAAGPTEFVNIDNVVIGPLAGDIDPPGPVTGLTATPGMTQIGLSWTNPTDGDFAGVKIRYKTSGYPSGPSDGTLLYQGTGTNCVHSGVVGGTIYYYAAFAYDEVPNHSSAATVQATPTSPYCFTETFSYANGPLSGSGGWSGGATQIVVENGMVKITGGAGTQLADRMVSCGSWGTVGAWVKIKSGSGGSTMWSVYFDDAAGNNLARWYGKGTTARGRIGTGTQTTGDQTLTGGWDDLYVKLNFAANTSEFFFNGAPIGTLNHAEFGAGDSVGRIRIERIDNVNATGHYMFLDDIMVGAADTTPPTATISAPSVPITMTGPVSYTVTFGETVRGFDSGSDIQVNSTGGASASSTVVTGSGVGPYTVTLSGISGSGTLGITARAAGCVDAGGLANSASAASATFSVVGSEGSISSLKGLPDNAPVGLANKALYLKQTGFGYIEEPDRSSGIRLEGSLAGAQDDRVLLSGIVKATAGGERYILVDAMATSGTGAVSPFGLSNRALAADLLTGVYVKAWGKVKPGSVTSNSFVLTDGSDAAGILVVCPGAPGVSDNEFVTVTGAAGFAGSRVIYKR